jgi:hypothetical protein
MKNDRRALCVAADLGPRRRNRSQPLAEYGRRRS